MEVFYIGANLLAIKHCEQELTDDEQKRRSNLISKGEVDFRSAIISLIQTQAYMFTYSIERNISDTMKSFSDIDSEIRDIDKQSKNIRQILSKTKMLSINAAIEAAHAGNTGKGFGVVADEIGVLANQTQTCTDEVEKISHAFSTTSRMSFKTLEDLVKSLQSFFSANESVDSCMKGLKQIEENGFILTTIAKRLENHADFMRNLIKNAGKSKVISNHHTCAFGKWYDMNTAKYRHLNGFSEMYATHEHFHNTAIEFNENLDLDSLTKLVVYSSEILSKFIILTNSFKDDIKLNNTYFTNDAV